MYDFYSFKTKDGKKYLVSKKLNNIVLGLIYAIYIFAGVIATNGIWYFVSDGINRVLLFIVAAFFTILFGAGWHYIGIVSTEPNVWTSLFRSLAETFAFTCVAVSSYCLWFLLPTQSLISNIVISLICTGLHLVLSYFAIKMEYEKKGLVRYGVLYFLSFIFGSTATSAFFAIYVGIVTKLWIHNVVTAVAFVITVLIPPKFYRGLRVDRENGMIERLSKRLIIYGTLSYFLLFLNFVIYTGLLNMLFIG